jgi:hypothetical protein
VVVLTLSRPATESLQQLSTPSSPRHSLSARHESPAIEREPRQKAPHALARACPVTNTSRCERFPAVDAANPADGCLLRPSLSSSHYPLAPTWKPYNEWKRSDLPRYERDAEARAVLEPLLRSLKRSLALNYTAQTLSTFGRLFPRTRTAAFTPSVTPARETDQHQDDSRLASSLPRRSHSIFPPILSSSSPSHPSPIPGSTHPRTLHERSYETVFARQCPTSITTGKVRKHLCPLPSPSTLATRDY